MKQTLSMLGVIALSLASCKKDRVCECVQTHTNFTGTTYSTVSTTHKKVTKSKAKKRCGNSSQLDSTITFYPNSGGVFISGNYYEDTFDCKLK